LPREAPSQRSVKGLDRYCDRHESTLLVTRRRAIEFVPIAVPVNSPRNPPDRSDAASSGCARAAADCRRGTGVD
jgi:hypothetical protein